MTADIETLCDGLGFLEGPVALPDGSCLYVDLERRNLSRVRPGRAPEIAAEPGGGPNGAAIGPDGAVYLCNSGGHKFTREAGLVRVAGTADDYSGGRIERVDLRTGKVERLYDQCDGNPLKGPNDLVFDKAGGFYFTDLGKRRARDRDNGGVYYALPDGSSIREIVYPMLTPNGIGLSPDERTLYVAETDTTRLWAFDIEAPGKLALLPHPSWNGGRLVYGPGGLQRFDSLKVEADGRVCIATLGNGGITVVDPVTGSAEHVAFPDPSVTNLCFGGAGLRTAYITLSASGRLIRTTWPRAGLPLNFVDRAC